MIDSTPHVTVRISRLAVASCLATPASVAIGVALYHALGGPSKTGWDALGPLFMGLIGAALVILIGFICGIVAWVRVARRPELTGLAFAVLGVVLPLLVVLGFAVMSTL